MAYHSGMKEHRWQEDSEGRGFLVCADCSEWCWPGQSVRGYYRMSGYDSVTGSSFSWTVFGPEPDHGGCQCLCPNPVRNVSVVEKCTFPVASSCDEVIVSDVMDS